MKNKKILLVIGFFLSFITTQAQDWTQVGSDIVGEDTGDKAGYSVSLSADGSIVAIGAPLKGAFDTKLSYVRVYQNTSGTWTQIGDDIEGEALNDYSGYSLSLSSDGSLVAIGAQYNNGTGIYAGHVRVYKNTSGTWTQIGDDIDGESGFDYSGASVSLSSDGLVVAIGAVGNDGSGKEAGHVRVYRTDGNTWTQLGADIDGEYAGDGSGLSVSLNYNGSIVAIGAMGNSATAYYAGHVRIFQFNNTSWAKIGSDIDGENKKDYSGRAVSLSADGSIVAIAATGNDQAGEQAGQVRVFQNINDVWTQIGSDINGEAEGDYSGASISLSSDGSILAIGAQGNDGAGSNAGHVRVYKYNSGSWIQLGLDIKGKAEGDLSGTVSLSADGLTVAIGACGNNSGYTGVYKFSTPLSIISNLSKIGISIYPNPTTGKFTINNEDFTIKSVEIADITGKIVKSLTINNSKQVIDLSNNYSGVYFIKINTSKGIFVEKIIKK